MTFADEQVHLDCDYFNVPLRRDILHNVFLYYRQLNWRTNKRVKTVGDTSGSRAKIRPQKGQGKARIGDKRAPHLKGGGKAHGPVPRDRSINMNKKTRL